MPDYQHDTAAMPARISVLLRGSSASGLAPVLTPGVTQMFPGSCNSVTARARLRSVLPPSSLLALGGAVSGASSKSASDNSSSSGGAQGSDKGETGALVRVRIGSLRGSVE